MTIKIGVIGCGYWGPNIIRNLSQISQVDVSYICDIDENKTNSIKKVYPNIRSVKDYREILKDPEVDAVAIVLPVGKHYEVAKEALLNNKHVLIEKPITASVKEAEDLIKIANEKNKIVMVDHTFEYHEGINKIKEIVDKQENKKFIEGFLKRNNESKHLRDFRTEGLKNESNEDSLDKHPFKFP